MSKYSFAVILYIIFSISVQIRADFKNVPSLKLSDEQLQSIENNEIPQYFEKLDTNSKNVYVKNVDVNRDIADLNPVHSVKKDLSNAITNRGTESQIKTRNIADRTENQSDKETNNQETESESETNKGTQTKTQNKNVTSETETQIKTDQGTETLVQNGTSNPDTESRYKTDSKIGNNVQATETLTENESQIETNQGTETPSRTGNIETIETQVQKGTLNENETYGETHNLETETNLGTTIQKGTEISDLENTKSKKATENKDLKNQTDTNSDYDYKDEEENDTPKIVTENSTEENKPITKEFGILVRIRTFFRTFWIFLKFIFTFHRPQNVE